MLKFASYEWYTPPARQEKPANHEQKDHQCSSVNHKERLLGMNDAMEVLSGKWKSNWSEL